MTNARHIGRYEIRSEIGRGSMGVVYLAHDPTLDRTVALKTFDLSADGDDARSAEFGQRFVREARAAAGLQHPNIVAVFDAGTDDESGVPFIAMEHVRGRSLKRILAVDGPLALESAVEMIASLASALRAAHGTGIVHRDVKPANVLVGDDDGRARLADFGVARFPGSELTRPEISPGTPVYMAPEQLKNGPVDARSDLFSLAAIFYEAVTGKKPFAGDDLPTLALAIVSDAHEPPSRLRTDLPVEVDRFFDSALAKDPDRRFQSAADFRAAVLDLAAGSDRRNWPAGSASIQAAGVDLEGAETHPALAPEGGAGDSANVPSAARPTVGGVDPPRRSGFKALLAIAAVIALTGLVWPLIDGGDVDVRLDARSRIAAGRVVVQVDEEVVFETELRAAPRHRGKLLRKITGREEQSFEAWLQLEPGKHEIVAHLTGAAGGQSSSDTIVVDLEPGISYELELGAGLSRRRPLELSMRASDPG